MYVIENTGGIRPLRRGERLVIKAFKNSDAMFKFLAEGSNALKWKESNKRLPAGTYAWAGGQWHNVRKLDPSVLAHI